MTIKHILLFKPICFVYQHYIPDYNNLQMTTTGEKNRHSGIVTLEMTSPGNNAIKAVLSLDKTPQMPQTQALQQLDHTLVVKVILCGV